MLQKFMLHVTFILDIFTCYLLHNFLKFKMKLTLFGCFASSRWKQAHKKDTTYIS
jgi:hypothetical protein